MTDWHFWKCSGAKTSCQASEVRGIKFLQHIHAISDSLCEAHRRMCAVHQTLCSARPEATKGQQHLGYAYRCHHLAPDFPP